MGPASSAASDSAAYFVITIVRPLENSIRMMPSSVLLRGVLPEGLVGGPLESQTRADAAHVHPGKAQTWSSTYFLHPTAHGPDELHHCRAEDRVAVKDQVSRRRVVWERFAQLLNYPRRRRVERCVEVQDMATAVLDDEEAVQQPKRRRSAP